MAYKKSEPKKAAKKKAAIKKPAKKVAAKKAGAKKAPPRKRVTLAKPRARRKKPVLPGFEPEPLESRAGAEAGDLQGLSDIAGADSESVDELLEEGNTFEAEVVKGVEDASEADQGEVRTHEVLEDDVPGEYHDQ